MLNHPNDSRTREELVRALEDLARQAREGIPGCGSASVTVLHEGEARTISTSDERALAIDEEQYDSKSGPCLSAMRKREIVDVPDYTTERRWPTVTARGREIGVYSGLSLPLEDDGDVLGALNLYGDSVGAFGDSSLMLADLFTRQATVVLRYLNRLQAERAQNARELAVAASLQRSLLPTVTDLPGISAAARYLVMGHDVTAAAAMGQLRSVLRSYAYEGSSPSVVLDRMDRLVQGFGMAEVATAIYGRLILDHGNGKLLYSNAGHLPPLLRHPGGRVERLDRGTHHLIGVLPPDQGSRGEAAAALPAGALLLLYTDGLVETRTRSFDDGIDLLAAALAAVQDDHTPAQICDALLEALVSGDPEDDAAVLAIHVNH
jgi:hypothetical protein